MSEQTVSEWFEKILADLEGDPDYECEKNLILLEEKFLKAGRYADQLRTALEKYGEHQNSCVMRPGRRSVSTSELWECTCGLEQALKEEKDTCTHAVATQKPNMTNPVCRLCGEPVLGNKE
jgi:hypothetical protein